MIKRAGSLFAALALVGMANGAQAQGEVTVGGVVEVIGGTSDHDKGKDGFDRGLFTRINVGYSNTLDNGIAINATINNIVHQEVDYAPDVVFMSVGGGFGTVTMGNHAPAACAMMPRPIALVPGGVNATWHSLFTGTDTSNVTHSEYGYCSTPTAISYATPSMGGLSAMVTYAPNTNADQTEAIGDAVDTGSNAEDYMAVAGSFSTDMGGMSLALGAAFQTAADDMIDSMTVAATVGMGGATVGFSWYDNGDAVVTGQDDGKDEYVYRSGFEGWTIGANYALGSLKPGITYSSQESDSRMIEETALVIGATYALGGGFSVFAEYLSMETEINGAEDEETILMSGAIVSF